jgi:protein TonB
MPRELFAQTMASRLAPKRSRWTIAGSILAHIGVIGALLIVPVLSTLDTFVIHAHNALQFTLPVIAVPAAPPSPSRRAAMASDINPHAAPSTSSEKPVMSEVIAPPAGDFRIESGGGPPTFGRGGNRGIDEVTLGTAPPVASTTPTGPVRPGGDIRFPARTTYIAPTYPALARTARVEGTVYLEATIDASGIVRDVRVLRGIPLLDDAARAAVSQWRYTPTTLNGVAVPVILTVTVTFTLR